MSPKYKANDRLSLRFLSVPKSFIFICLLFCYQYGFSQAIVTISGPNEVCAGAATSYSVSANVSYGNVSWSITGGTINGSSTSSSVSVTINAGGGLLSVTILNGSTYLGNTSKNVAALTTPTATLTSPSLICSGSPNATFSVTATGGSLTYQWYYNSAIVTGATSSTYTRSVTQGIPVYCRVTNACGLVNTSTYNVQITQSVAPTPLTITPSKLSFCTGEQLTLTVTNQYLTGSSTYVWKLAGNTISTASTCNVSVTTDTNIPNAYSPGDQITLDVTNLSAPCLSPTSTSANFSTAVTITPPPSMPASAVDVSRCGAGQVNLSATPGANADRIRWYTASDVFITESTGSYQPTISATTQYKVSSYNSSNQCQSSKSPLSGIIKSIPNAAATPVTICSGNGPNISITNPNNVPGTVFSWTASTTNVSGASAGTNSPINQTLTTSGIQGTVTYTITPVANGCSGTSVPVLVTVKPTPSVSASDQMFCSGNATSIAITNPNNVAGTSLNWTATASNVTGAASGTGSAINQSLNSSNGTSNGTVVYTITAAVNGCSSSTAANVTVKPNPSITNTVAQLQKTIFSGSPLNFTPASSIAGSTFTWTSNTTGTLTGVTAIGAGAITDGPNNTAADAIATYHITPVLNGCSGIIKDYAVTVLKVPEITSSLPFIAIGSSATLSVGTYDSYSWLNSSNVTVGSAATFNASVAGTYRVTITKPGATVTTASFTLGTQLSSINMNLIITNTALVKNLTDKNSVNSQTVEKVSQSIVYFDGLGRAIQNVMTQGSPLKSDVVVPTRYDVLGREFVKYLPVTLGNDGKYKDNLLDAAGNYTGAVQNYYNNSSDKIADDPSPYGLTVFEASPLNRVLKHGSVGTAWQPNGVNTYASLDKTIKFAYETNAANEVLLWTYTYPTASFPFGLVNATSAATPAVANYHSTNTLYKSKVHDESNNEVIEYTDRDGHIILKRVQAVSGTPAVNDTNYASTYYIYDDYGNLVAVIPPEATSKLAIEYYQAGANDISKNSFLSRWAFRYVYDFRKRMIEKHVPGAASVYMVYDNRDRLILTQDGNQRTDAGGSITKKEWTFIKYDILNRPIITGIYTHGSVVNQADMQAYLNTQMISGNQFYEDYNGIVSTEGYTNRTFPISGASTLTVTYYDNYSFRSLWSGTYDYVKRRFRASQKFADLYSTCNREFKRTWIDHRNKSEGH